MYTLILHGRRVIELLKRRNLRISLTLLQNTSFSSSPDVIPRKGQNFTVSSYLVDSLGLTKKLADSLSKKVNFDERVILILSCLFSEAMDADESLAPKLKLLQNRGASTSELTEVLSKVPKILRIKKDKALGRYYDFGSKQENKIRNVLVLRDLGVPQRLLFPLLISRSAHVCGKERFEESLKKVIEMGFDPRTPKFVKALHTVYELSDKTIEEKVDVYKRLGFAVGDVWKIFKKHPSFLKFSEKNISNSMDTFLGLGFSRVELAGMVRRFPQCIGLSAETVKKKNEFLVEKMKWPLKSLALFPHVFGCSMEKRIVPRCEVIKALMSKGLIRSELPSVSSVLACTDYMFLIKYVRKHDDKELKAELMAIFTKDGGDL
ncbi:unnamed protein product [Eruca vesicaria subsp. sativa]|uniref:Uncharacterized protein n=1 Tax=Eruca vesicaria subsp. sativa TaxID=29727 RepID=A0ABC8KBF6_ERUVS|nr:unnamed protein product [Eruca vesicaria subsp. sativa]